MLLTQSKCMQLMLGDRVRAWVRARIVTRVEARTKAKSVEAQTKYTYQKNNPFDVTAPLPLWTDKYKTTLESNSHTNLK